MTLLKKLEQKYPVEYAESSDFSEIIALFNTVWSASQQLVARNEKLFIRRYFNNPFANDTLSIFAAKDGSKIIGITGLLKFDLSYHQKRLPAVWVVDQAVLPEYQIKGIGYLLLKKAIQESAIAIAGDNNAPSQKMHKSMGMKAIAHCTVMRKWVRPTNYFNFKKRAGIRIVHGVSFDRQFDRLWEKARSEYDIVAIRNADVLRWRYENLPTRKFQTHALYKDGELYGYIVTTMGKVRDLAPKGVFVDFLFCQIDEGLIATFIMSVIAYLAKNGAVCFEAALSQRRVRKIFESLGFKDFDYDPNFIVYNNDFSRDKPDLWDGRKWHLTYGDADFFFTR